MGFILYFLSHDAKEGKKEATLSGPNPPPSGKGETGLKLQPGTKHQCCTTQAADHGESGHIKRKVPHIVASHTAISELWCSQQLLHIWCQGYTNRIRALPGHVTTYLPVSYTGALQIEALPCLIHK